MSENNNNDDFPHPDPIAGYVQKHRRDTKSESRRIGLFLLITSLLLYFFFPILLAIAWFNPSPRGGHFSYEMIFAIYAQLGFLGSALVALVASFYIRWAFFWFLIAFVTSMMYLPIIF